MNPAAALPVLVPLECMPFLLTQQATVFRRCGSNSTHVESGKPPVPTGKAAPVTRNHGSLAPLAVLWLRMLHDCMKGSLLSLTHWSEMGNATSFVRVLESIVIVLLSGD